MSGSIVSGMNEYLLGTCIVIDILRTKPEAMAFLYRLDAKPCLSVVTVAELYSGARRGEMPALKAMLDASEIFEVTYTISIQAGLWRHQYRPSHGVDIPDALIAATSHKQGLTLATSNTKHFPMLAQVYRPY